MYYDQQYHYNFSCLQETGKSNITKKLLIIHYVRDNLDDNDRKIVTFTEYVCKIIVDIRGFSNDKILQMRKYLMKKHILLSLSFD